MGRVFLYSVLLIAGLAASQFINSSGSVLVAALTMITLSFIMIHVGYEFEIDKSRPAKYLWDYLVAFTAAAFPWIFVAFYFVFVMTPSDLWASARNWQESLLLARFAAPTSAGILLSMLAATGLVGTWIFSKTRILVIFDDLDTVLLLIPLKIMMVGLKWQLLVIIIIIIVLLFLAWRYLHVVPLPVSWPWVLGYSAVITAACEAIYYTSKIVHDDVPVQLEVLLPAFVLGCMLRRGHTSPHEQGANVDADIHSKKEERAGVFISACFMVLVGLSLPPIQASFAGAGISWQVLIFHVVIVTLLSNLGKMFPALCYRKEASLRERLAVCVSMFPRGEVGAGILVISLAYGISGLPVAVAVLSLTVNLAATGLFILLAKWLIQQPSAQAQLVRLTNE